ncbi:uncharacterized protein LOC117178575 [Belonocnema kinseyi]|uniref:uncharacterized protein LOC117178575 n=1 Tax=Belonocnema kinseyi TaxID=2817044 RepID=UPI00143DB26D|nr:uncharacterized protein LOC117178575 [Belonocnema kinseyi]
MQRRIFIKNVKADKDIKQSRKIGPHFGVSLIDEKRKVAEFKIAAFVSEHCSVQTIDHLGELITVLDKDSKVLPKVKLHGTKCTGLIVNILSPCLFEELLVEIGISWYSLILDEITALDAKKGLGFMIRYFSKKFRQVRTTFYRLMEIESGTAEATTKTIKKQLEDDGVKLDKQIVLGIGVDGANAMISAHNSVSSRLAESNPHIITIKCLPHSLYKCAKNACDVLPRLLDTIVKEFTR